MPYVYIMANPKGGSLYIGVTNDILRRAYEHRTGIYEGFTQKYHVHILVYFEELATFPEAIARGKQLKHWLRQWKLDLIAKRNPSWRDLYPFLVGAEPDPRLPE